MVVKGNSERSLHNASKIVKCQSTVDKAFDSMILIILLIKHIQFYSICMFKKKNGRLLEH